MRKKSLVFICSDGKVLIKTYLIATFMRVNSSNFDTALAQYQRRCDNAAA